MANKLHELLERRAHVVQAMRTINDTAEADKRDYTSDEDKKHKELKTELTGLDKKIEVARDLQEAERSAPAILHHGRGDGQFETRARDFSLVKAINARLGEDVDAAFEREISQEVARRSGRKFSGTSWRDRHGRRRYFFRVQGRKYPLPDKPGAVEFHVAYARFLSELAAETLGRREAAFIKGTIGWVIEQFLSSAQYDQLADNTRRNYRRVLDTLKAKLGAGRIADLQPNHIRIVRDEIASTSTASADMASMLFGVLWDHAAEFLKLDLGVNPARDVRKVHDANRRKPHEPWPAEVIEAFLGAASEQMKLALYLLLYTGQRVGDVCTMKWSDIANGRITLIQQKTGQRVVIPVHKRLAAILKDTPRKSGFILNNRHGRPYKNADALSGVIKRVLIDDLSGASQLTTHGLRKNAGIALAEAGCTVSEIMAILGHKTPAQAIAYVERANRGKLADSGVRKRERAGAA